MDAFIVSARKYRPQHFNTVVGQGHITSTLKNAIVTGQLAHAYLFCGPRGVGKTTCARIFAKTINCTNITADGEACDQCESCQSFNSGASLNVYELDAASNNSVEDIRSLVDQVRFAPQLGQYKVYIIDEVHMLSSAAFNAFLKTLEEPPRHAKFILATTEKHKILPTILSRCQVFTFNRIRVEDISRHLAWLAGNEHVRFEQEALDVIAQKADGGLRDACSIFDQMVAFTNNDLTYKAVVENLNVLDYDYYFRITEELLQVNISAVLLTFDEILRNGFDAHNFLNGLAEHLRNLLVSRDPQTLTLLEGSDTLRKRYATQATQCPAPFLMRALSLLSNADVNYKGARNPRLLVETTLMQLAWMNAPQDEKKNDEPAASPAAVNQAPTAKAPAEPAVKTVERPSLSIEQMKLRSTTFRIQGALKGKSPTAEATVVVDPPQVYDNQPVTLDDVESAIREFAAEKQKAGQRQVATILSTAKITLTDNLIELSLANEAQREQLQALRQDLIDLLRSRLRNKHLGMDVRVPDAPAVVKAYKPVDIFKAMAEKNRTLVELKKRFDLEIDY